MKLFLIGCIIGIGKILPGISGSILAIRLNVYERAIDAIVNFFKNKKDNSIFLTKLGLGFIIMTIIGSKVLLVFINRYELPLKIIFTMLIITGVPTILKHSKSFLIVVLSFLLAYTLSFLPQMDNTPNYFLMGAIEAFSTIVPGISGTAIYLSLGWYDDVLHLFGNLYLFEFAKIIPFTFGLAISGFMFLRMLSFMFKKYRDYTYSAILGFLLASIVLMHI